MNRAREVLCTSVACAVFLAPSASHAQAAEQAAEQTAEQEVRAVAEAFKAALDAQDGAAALELLHPDIRIYENARVDTKAGYESGHLAADMAFSATTTNTTQRAEVIVAPEMALYLSEYSTEGEFRGREIDTRGLETIVLVPTDEGWKIRHIHWSSRSANR